MHTRVVFRTKFAATPLYLDFGLLLGPRGESHYEAVPGLRLARLRF
jgi:hypothetical protein